MPKTPTTRKISTKTTKSFSTVNGSSVYVDKNGKKRCKTPWDLDFSEWEKIYPKLKEHYYNYVKDTLKTDATRKAYVNDTGFVLNWISGKKLSNGETLPDPCTTDDLREIVKDGTEAKDIKVLEDLLREYVRYLKNERLTAYQTQKHYITSIASYLSDCRITINVKYVSKVMSKNSSQAVEGWTKDEIQKMLETRIATKKRVKAMMLVLASTGIRREALVHLNVGHLEPIEEEGIYKIRVYADDQEDPLAEYQTFCTPEARNAIDEMLDERRNGKEYISNIPDTNPRTKQTTKRVKKVRDPEHITEDSPLFINETKEISRLSTDRVYEIVRRACIDAQLGDRVLADNHLKQKGQNGKHRQTKAVLHSFRHFYQTALENSTVLQNDEEIPAISITKQKQLMGHKISGDLQLRYTDKDVTELLKAYKKAIKNLTVTEKAQLQAKVEDLVEGSNDNEVQLSKDVDELKEGLLKKDQAILELTKQVQALSRQIATSQQINQYENEIEGLSEDQRVEVIIRDKPDNPHRKKTVRVNPDKAYLV